MAPDEIVRIVGSWEKVASQGDRLAACFYGELFRKRPKWRALFPDDLTGQQQKLMATLNQAVMYLYAQEEMQPILRGLGARHVAYGAREEHYGPVGEALLVGLEDCLGEGFDPALKQA